jgi:hypothetical protein
MPIEDQRQFVEDQRRKRLLFFNAVYEQVKHKPQQSAVEVDELAAELGFPNEGTPIASYLVDEGLLSHMGMDGVTITHQGICEMEESIGNPERPTEHFPPLNVTINNHIGQATNVVLTQASPGSTINTTFGGQAHEMMYLLKELKEGIAAAPDIQEGERAVALATVDAIESRTNSDKMDAVTLVGMVNALMGILNVATTNSVILGLGHRLLAWFEGIPQC